MLDELTGWQSLHPALTALDHETFASVDGSRDPSRVDGPGRGVVEHPAEAVRRFARQPVFFSAAAVSSAGVTGVGAAALRARVVCRA